MNIFKNKILIKIAFINYLFFTLYIIMFFNHIILIMFFQIENFKY